jgi:polysaccharide deacetylase family protein (PEP-CTERM system associated)
MKATMSVPLSPAPLPQAGEGGFVSRSRDFHVNALTVDVEDYFQVSALAPHIARHRWDAMPCRVERNVDRLLQLFERHRAHATFFTLGWIAERYPRIVRDIAAAGHEIASHGYGHLRASEQTPDEFSADIRRAKQLLEDTAGVEVLGYRAPSFSIGHANPWAFDCIADAGYRYSSSVYPVRHDHYGMPDAPRFPYEVRPGLIEIPMTTTRLLGRNLPAAGGGYFRFLPYPVSQWAIRRVNRVDGRPAIFYFHPWEIDPDQPRVAGVSLKTRFRHYVNLHRTEARLSLLLADFHWDRVDRAFGLRPS